MSELPDDEEFWRLPIVERKSGLSRSEIYRRVGLGRFPQPRSYKHSNKSFWLASEIRNWQREQVSL